MWFFFYIVFSESKYFVKDLFGVNDYISCFFLVGWRVEWFFFLLRWVREFRSRVFLWINSFCVGEVERDLREVSF